MSFELQAASELDKLRTMAETIRDVDCHTAAGVLSFETEQGVYVINRQIPTRQLWLSSPVSGPQHFDLVGGRFEHAGVPISDMLRSELEKMR